MSFAFRRSLALAAAGLVLISLSCGKDKPPPPPASTLAVGGATPSAAPGSASERPNIVLITMEATRADHLGCYNDPTAVTPALDELSREGATFEQAIATAPLTLPSLASILTGAYPPRHGVRDDAGYTLDGSQTTLAEHLKAAGYATGAAVGSRLLAGDAGLKQGFDSYAQPARGSRSSAFVINDAIDAVNRMKGGPFFLWVQLDDPQFPYEPPPGLRPKFPGRLYDAEIAWMDIQLKRFFDHLRNQGVFDNSIVVAVATEGESLGEHGEDTHGLLLYEATVKVPLIVRYPARIKGMTRSKSLVSLIDLAPTLVELAGAPPLSAAQGKSFVSSLAGAAVPRQAVYSESLFGQKAYDWVPLHAFRTDALKVIDAPETEIYNIKRDPSETINLAGKDAAATASLRPQLDALMQTIGVPSAEAVPVQSRRDAKALIASNNFFVKGKMAVEDGQAEQAVPLLVQALARDPQNQPAKSLLSALRGETIEPAGKGPRTFAQEWNLGNAYYVQGKLADAVKSFRAALALNPASAQTHYVLANVLADSGDEAGAESELRAAVSADPKLADAWNKLGILYDKAKKRPEALDAFSKALDTSPDHADALFNRAKIELLETYLVDARRDVDHLLQKHDDYAAGHYLNAHLCLAEKNPAGAKAALTKYLSLPNIDPRMKASAEDMLAKVGG